MMDISDSLSIDADRLARASAARIELYSALLLEAFGVQRGVAVPVAAMLTGGEDHGLLATFPEGAVLPAGFAAIGRVLPADPEPGVTLDGEPQEPAGWDPYVVRWPGA